MSSGEEFPLYSEVTYSLYVLYFFLNQHWLFQLVISPYICKLFSGLAHVYVDKF